MTGDLVIETKSSTREAFDFSRPGRYIAPSLLSADFSRLESEVRVIERAGAQVLHLDVMDGHFVPNISFGAPVIASLRKCTELFFDAHLMISEPLRYAEPFAKAGCDLITFHGEVTDKPREIVDHIHALGAQAGVALNPTTPVSAIEAILDHVELVLVMSVWPGFGGQSFIADVLDKVEELAGRLAPHQRLEIDGGIDLNTISDAARAGADVLVAGTAVFRRDDPAEAFQALQRKANACGKKRGAQPENS